MDRRTAILYAKLNPFQSIVKNTSGFIARALHRVKNPYVAFSFGKDSSVMLHLILQQKPNIPVIFVKRPETDLLDNFNETIALWNLKSLIVLDGISFLEGGLNQEKHLTKSMDYDSYFLGLRKEESTERKISLDIHGKFYKNKDNKIRICPMSDWKTNDIAAYCLANNLPVLSKYTKEGFRSRTTAGIPAPCPQLAISWIKRNNTENYNKLLKLFPDAKYYT